MGVTRTDYLIWGAKVDPKRYDYDEFEAECYDEPGKRFDMIYDGMSGNYCFAGKIVAKSDPYEGLDCTEIDQSLVIGDADVEIAVKQAIPEAKDFKLYLFTHFH